VGGEKKNVTYEDGVPFDCGYPGIMPLTPSFGAHIQHADFDVLADLCGHNT
jgi:hypothetical protein